MPGYPSGQRGQTVNLLAIAFGSSNLSPGTIFATICPGSSAVEHFHGKEGVTSSILVLGSMKGNNMAAKKLQLSSNDVKISGVCGGIAEYFDADPSIVRLGWALLVLITGIFPGIILYIIAAMILPKEGK
jgi:phage shock protein C